MDVVNTSFQRMNNLKILLFSFFGLLQFENAQDYPLEYFRSPLDIPIFLAGIINDVIVGIPIGISSLCYLLICSVTAYIRNITLSANFINDWVSILFTVLLINSIQILILDFIFNNNPDYLSYLINSGFTFILYPLFYLIFNYLDHKISLQPND